MISDQLKETTSYIQTQTNFKASVGIILGSGLGSFAKEIQIEKKIDYKDIPHFKSPTVVGHNGQMIFGWINQTPVVCLKGRIHYYEGHTIESVVYPTRCIARLGIKKLIITNAAGGLADEMEPGDFMVINDHINLMGTNPLIGPNDESLGPRFPDMSEAYSKELQGSLLKVLKTHNIRFHQGVYCALTGPTYETPAEIRHLKLIGASAVGMSTVPEVIAAHHMGIKVCGISCITNKAAGLSQSKLSHAEVTETANRVESQFTAFLKDFVISIGS